MITQKFPDAYDVTEVINLKGIHIDNVRRFTARKGLLVAARGRNEFAKVLAKLVLAHQDYLELRYFAQGGTASTRISGFNLRDYSIPKRSIQEIYQDLLNLRAKMLQQSLPQSGSSRIEMSPPRIEESKIVAEYKYEKVTPGKIELLSRSQQAVPFSITEIQSGVWEVICMPDFNQDVETLNKLLSRLDKTSLEVYAISLDDFEVSDRIAFFDRLLAYYSGIDEEWRLRHVCGLVVRQPNQEEEDPIFDIGSDLSMGDVLNDEQSALQASSSDLRTITQAALEGKNLRTNSFVMQCLHEGFYFSSVSLELENKSSAEVIRVQVRFKLSPKLFEVILMYSGIVYPIGEREAKFSPQRDKEILTHLWIISHKIWHEIKSNLPVSKTEGRQTIMNLRNGVVNEEDILEPV